MMEKRNTNKILILIIAILLISNIAILTFFLMKKDGGHMEKRPDRKTMIADFLKKEIGFTPAQLQQYDTLSDRHRDNVRKMYDSHRGSKDKQFKQLAAANFNDSVMASVAGESAESQRVIELQMFNHLKSIRTLCTPEQLPKFDSLFVKILNRRGGEGRKKPGN